MGRPPLPNALTAHERQVRRRDRVKAVLDAARAVSVGVAFGDVLGETAEGKRALGALTEAVGRLQRNGGRSQG